MVWGILPKRNILRYNRRRSRTWNAAGLRRRMWSETERSGGEGESPHFPRFVRSPFGIPLILEFRFWSSFLESVFGKLVMDILPKQVVLIGVGLLGGSIALSLRRRFPTILVEALRYRSETGFTSYDLRSVYPDAFGNRSESLAVQRELSDEDSLASSVSSRTETEPSEVLRRADLVVVCTPVQTIATIVREVATFATAQTLITDVGSTKREIVTMLDSDGPLANGARYLGAHPIAGSDRSGPQFADPTLFEGRVVAITPTERTLPEDVWTLQRFWRSLGAICRTLTPAAHDRILARTSHLPHFIAATLTSCISEKDYPFLGTGFRDTTRIAAGLPSLWGPIFRSNREPLLDAITELQVKLSLFRAAIEADDVTTMDGFLTTAENIRRELDSPLSPGKE